MDINQINKEIDDNIRETPPRNITSAILRGLLKKITQFLQDKATEIGQYASFYPQTRWTGTVLEVRNPDGSWAPGVNLRGVTDINSAPTRAAALTAATGSDPKFFVVTADETQANESRVTYLFKPGVGLEEILTGSIRLDGKMRAITGKGLSKNDFSDVHKAAFVEGKNLLDKTRIVAGAFSFGSGQISPATDYRRTDYIPVKPNTTYTVSGINVGFVGNEYDASFNRTATLSTNGGPAFTSRTFTTSATAAYVGINVSSSAANTAYDATAQLEVGSVATAYDSYRGLSLDVSRFSGPIPNTVLRTEILKTGKNLLDKAKIVAGSYFLFSSGATGTNASWRRTGYIEVLPNTTYTVSGIGTQVVGHEFDAAFVRTQVLGDNVGIKTSFTFTTTATAKYVGINISSQSTAAFDATAQLEVGNGATAYEPYVGGAGVDGSKVIGPIAGVAYKGDLPAVALGLPRCFVSYHPTGYNGRPLFTVYTKYAEGSAYYAGYKIPHLYDLSGIRVDMYRIVGADLFKYENGVMVAQGKELLATGESESVYKEAGKSDFTGGVHGDEIKTEVYFYLGSVRLSAAELSSAFTLVPCSEFSYVQKTNMLETDNATDVIECIHHKRTRFITGGYETFNRLIWQRAVSVAVWYCGICCISTPQSDVLYSEDLDYFTMTRNNGETEFLNKAGIHEINYYSAIHNLGAFVFSKIEKPLAEDANAILSFKDNATYSKYYRGLKNKTANAGDVWEGRMTVRHYSR